MFFLIWMLSFPPLLFTSSYWLNTCHSCYSQEHHVQTGRGSVSVIVCGDQDKPPLITYPDLALNRKCFVLYLCCDFDGDILYIWFLVILCEINFKWCLCPEFLQICHVFKDYSFSQKQLRCYFITFASTISALLDMRSILLLSKFVSWITLGFSWILYSHNFLFGTLPRVLAVRSWWDLWGWSFTLCRWFSRSNPWGSQLFWVITLVPLLRYWIWDKRLCSWLNTGIFLLQTRCSYVHGGDSWRLHS